MSAPVLPPPDCAPSSAGPHPAVPRKVAPPAPGGTLSAPGSLPDDLLIRPALPADTEAVSRMLARSYRALLAPDYAPALLREALPLISQARPSLLSCGTYFVAESDDRILAAGGWTDFSPHGSPGRTGEGHLRHVATDPMLVRAGLGRRILTRILSSARAAGVRRLHCQATLTAVPFYAALGFERVARIDVRLPTGVLFPAVQMRRLE
ncbi:GNAT family N-acetyltransferase [Pseudooceanicola aestuarii]|uniref:GNAT family N-acetyltransferase n=1 Tax=Pseudooceanicola aestuarii TaxID=2697319 RepID=UPI0013D53423|nr:GNAT family N-acetyltransferase [Pseudooceanicola aestuarii]